MEYTINEIKNMTDQELSEINKKLGVKVMSRFAWFFISKWALIFGINYAIKKYLKASQK